MGIGLLLLLVGVIIAFLGIRGTYQFIPPWATIANKQSPERIASSVIDTSVTIGGVRLVK